MMPFWQLFGNFFRVRLRSRKVDLVAWDSSRKMIEEQRL
jgi:hypothetical protein